MRKAACLLSLCLLTLAVLPAAGANWPRFRGPNGVGTAADKGVPVTFGEQEGILWKVPLPGPGNSSPVVWGDKVFVQTASRDARERSLVCLSAADGKVLWSRSVPGKPPLPKKLHDKNTLASSTPAVDGERVYVCFWDGRRLLLAAFDHDGQEAWRKDLGEFDSQHGAGASPVVHGGKVFLANDQDDKSSLAAFDCKTGEVAWKVGRPAHRACYSAPFVREEQGMAPELVVLSTMELTGYDPETGKKNWAWNWKFTAKMPLRTTASPILVDGVLIGCSGDGGGDRHAVAVQLGNGKGTRPALLWENKKDFPYVPTPLSRGEHVYFVNDRGVAGCYVAKTGERVWFERLEGATFVSSPVLIDGKMYAASEAGDVFVIAAEPTYRLLARNSLGEAVRASPAVADGRLYIRGQNHLFCVGKSSGR